MTQSQELVTVEAVHSIFGTDEPVDIVRRVTAVAGPLADFIKRQRMTVHINKREYVLAEGWAFMGSMLGVFPVTRRVSELRDPEGVLLGFEAQVELVTRDGGIVGGAIGECAWVEQNWGDRDPFALKSMAQTRAAGKAYRMAFGFVMKAAGYDPTPAEEMPLEAHARPTDESLGDSRPGAEQPAQRGSFANVGQFLKWAWDEHHLQRDDVLRLLAVDGKGLMEVDLDEAEQLILLAVAGAPA